MQPNPKPNKVLKLLFVREKKTITDVVFKDTKKIDKVKQVDPLGITNLRNVAN